MSFLIESTLDLLFSSINIVLGIAVFERRKLQQTLATHRKAQKVAEEQLNLTLAKMAAVQQEVEVLQRQLKVVHYVGKASPAISSSGLSKMSEGQSVLPLGEHLLRYSI